MPDRIKEILEGHIRLTQRQLEFVRSGVDFSFFKEGEAALPITEGDLQKRLAGLQETLARHEARDHA